MTNQDTNPNIKSATGDKAGSAGQGDVVKKHEYEFHPIANVFPLMTGGEFDRLKEDIKANKLLVPITTFEGKILDGRNRYRAMMEAGLQYMLKEESFKPYNGTKPLEFVISANIHRRHLDTSQRATIAAKLVTTKLGDNQHMGGVTIAAAAKMLNVSEALVKASKDVLEKASAAILEKVQKGQVRVSALKDIITKPKEQQEAALKDAQKAARERARAAKANKEPSKAKVTAPSTKKSDEVDVLVDTLVDLLKEWRKEDAASAIAATANLIRLLEAADLVKEDEEYEAEAA